MRILLYSNLITWLSNDSGTRFSATSASPSGTAPDVLIADLASQAEVRHVSDEISSRYRRLDVLINNAGAIYSSRRLTPDGVELTWASGLM